MDEDAVLLAIGRLTEAVRGQGREIAQLRQDIKESKAERESCCKDCRTEIDSHQKEQDDRLDIIEKQHDGEKAVESKQEQARSIWDSNWTKGGIVAGAILGAAGFIWQVLH